MRISLTLTVLAVAAGRPAEAQAPPILTVVEDVRISGRGYGFASLKVSPTGAIASLDTDAARQRRIRVFSSAGVLTTTIAAGEPASISMDNLTPDKQWGWVGDSIWVFSAVRGAATGTLSVVELAPAARVVMTRQVAQATPGPPGTSPQLPPDLIGFRTVTAAYGDGGILAIQGFPGLQLNVALGRNDFAATGNYSLLVRTDGDGRFVSAAPRRPPNWNSTCERVHDIPRLGRSLAFRIPFCDAPSGVESADGKFMVYARATAEGDASATIHVSKVTISGDTVFAKHYTVPAAFVTSAEADSARRAELARLDRQEDGYPGIRAFGEQIMRTEMPRIHQAVRRVIAGVDGTVIIELPGRGARRFLAIDARGDAIGILDAPLPVGVIEGSSDFLWGVTRGGAGTDLVRLRIAR